MVQKKVICRGLELDLMPARLALYTFFAMLKKDCTLPVPSCSRCTDCFLGLEGIFKYQQKITDRYRRLAGNRPVEEMSDSGIVNLNAENFAMYKSKIRQDLQKSFGLYDLKDLEIASVGKRPNTRYGIGMDKGKIEIVY